MTTTTLIQPKLALNFQSGVFNPIITFARADATATRINDLGLIEIVAANTPRIDYDPSNLVCKGLLIEEQRINILPNSEQFDNPTWLKSFAGTGSIPVITPNAEVAPDGTMTADRIDFNIGAGTSAVDTSLIISPSTLVAATAYTAAIYFKAATAGDVGKTLVLRHFGAGLYGVITLTNTWQRFIRTEVAAAGTRFMSFGLVGNQPSSKTASAFVWGAQLERGAFATSYIPTAATAVTRNADVATITGSNFTSFWNALQGGAQVQATPSTVSGIAPLVQFDDGSANEIIALRGNTTNPELYIVDGGTPQAQLDAGTIAANTAYSLTGWWQTNDCKASKDSGAVVTDATATIPTVTQARIGSDGTNYLNGTIATINYYDSFFGQPIYTRRKNKVFSSLL